MDTERETERAIVEIEIEHPDPAVTAQAWTVFWDGRAATVHRAEGVDAGDPHDWGIRCCDPEYTDAWRASADGYARVVEEVLDGFAGAGADAEIVAMLGNPRACQRALEQLRGTTPTSTHNARRRYADSPPWRPARNRTNRDLSERRRTCTGPTTTG